MTVFRNSAAAALILCLAVPASFAQDAATPAPEAPATGGTPATDAPATATPETTTPAPQAPATGTPATPPAQTGNQAVPTEGPGSSYIAETFGDWNLQCFRSEDGDDPCQMYQLLHDAKGTAVADISMIALPPGGKAVAGATIMTPLETLLTANLALKVDDQAPRGYPFTFCAQVGCFSRIGLLPDELTQFKKGNKVTLTIVPIAAPNQPVNVEISLKGFTSAYEAVSQRNKDLQLQR